MKYYFWICIVVCNFSVGMALAEGWYVGAEVGEVNHEFFPDYTFRTGAPNIQFVNRSDGTELGIIGGYEKKVCNFFSTRFQARGSWNDSEWALFLPNEPANFRYSIEYNVGLSVVSVVHLHRFINILFELGLQQGYVEEKKDSPVTSSLDFAEWVGGTVIGYGISSNISETVSIALSYREADFDQLSYKSYLPNGTHQETISDEPEAESYTLSLIIKF